MRVHAAMVFSFAAAMMVLVVGGRAQGPAATAPALRQPPGGGPSVQMVALGVTRTADNELLRLAQDRFNSDGGGTKLSFALRYPDAEILQVNAVAITSFTDDVGTDLGDGVGARRSGIDEKPYALTSSGKLLVLRLASTRVPAESATGVTIRGTVSLRTAKGSSELKPVTLPLRVGRSLEIPDGKLTLTAMTETFARAQEGFQLSFSTSGNMDRIKNLRFASEDGTAIPATVTVQRTDRTSVTVQLARIVTTAVITPVLYDEVKAVQIPLDVKVGVNAVAAPAREGQP